MITASLGMTSIVLASVESMRNTTNMTEGSDTGGLTSSSGTGTSGSEGGGTGTSGSEGGSSSSP